MEVNSGQFLNTLIKIQAIKEGDKRFVKVIELFEKRGLTIIEGLELITEMQMILADDENADL